MLITLPFFDHFALVTIVDSSVRTATMQMLMNRGPSGIEFNPATQAHGISPHRRAERDNGRQHCVKAGELALTQHRRPRSELRVGSDGVVWTDQDQAVARPSDAGQRRESVRTAETSQCWSDADSAIIALAGLGPVHHFQF
jgi:hypothetical protein